MQWLVLLFATAWAASLGAAGAPTTSGPYFGFTAFPYDMSAEAIARTYKTVNDNSTFFALHLDDGIPWDEALAAAPMPARVQRDWDEWRSHVPAGRPVYLGLAPLAKDRKSLAPGLGGAALPRALRGAALDDPRVKQAYLHYARRAVEQFNPAWVNIGIEAGELASRDPARWSQYASLYEHVRKALKQAFPGLQVGMSFGLQSLRRPGVLERVRDVIEASDYLGLSFYPYASAFGEKFGDPPLGPGAQAWREPLAWIRATTSKPIAIAETGYTTHDIAVPSFGLHMRGDAALQAAYVRELADTARRDRYLFVVWFLAIDYDRLYDRHLKGDEVSRLWKNIGLIDGDLVPKPAWEEWQRALAGGSGVPSAVAGTQDASAGRAEVPAPRVQAKGARSLGIVGPDLPLQCAPGGRSVSRAEGPSPGSAAFLWEYSYAAKGWQWCIRNLPSGALAGATRVRFQMRSDRPGTIFVQFEEADGEAFFAKLEPAAEWSTVTLDLASLAPDPAKRRDGRLSAERITKLLIADAAAGSGATGTRTVWFTDWLAD